MSGLSNMEFLRLCIHLAVIGLLSTFCVAENVLEIEITGLKISILTKQNLYCFVIVLQARTCLMFQLNLLEIRDCQLNSQLWFSFYLLLSCSAVGDFEGWNRPGILSPLSVAVHLQSNCYLKPYGRISFLSQHIYIVTYFL